MSSLEVVHPAALSLPIWPAEPEPVDPTGASYLIVSIGGVDAAAVSGQWVQQAEGIAATTLLVLDDFDTGAEDQFRAELLRARTGVRIMVVGSQFAVLSALSLARSEGAGPAELRSFVTRRDDIAVYCAHCRDTSRAQAEPGGIVECALCSRELEVHQHMSAVRGSFLASDVKARDLV